jgi:hypothetical protein
MCKEGIIKMNGSLCLTYKYRILKEVYVTVLFQEFVQLMNNNILVC